jgi:hypothetical protein
LEAFKPTVLNCFLFRQTDLIPGLAVRKRAAPLYFKQQRRPGKMKALFTLHLHHDPYEDPKDSKFVVKNAFTQVLKLKRQTIESFLTLSFGRGPGEGLSGHQALHPFLQTCQTCL